MVTILNVPMLMGEISWALITLEKELHTLCGWKENENQCFAKLASLWATQTHLVSPIPIHFRAICNIFRGIVGMGLCVFVCSWRGNMCDCLTTPITQEELFNSRKIWEELLEQSHRRARGEIDINVLSGMTFSKRNNWGYKNTTQLRAHNSWVLYKLLLIGSLFENVNHSRKLTWICSLLEAFSRSFS